MIDFAAPGLLWGLALLPAIALGARRRRRPAALLFPSAELPRPAARGRRVGRGGWLLALRLAALALLVLALARPRQGLGSVDVEASGVDIVLAIDVSGSMRALDFELDGHRASRLAVVKDVVRRFIEDRPDDRIGMVAFAARPYLVSPLTLDHDWLVRNLSRLEVGLIEDGTAIGSAIAAAANRLRDLPGRSRVAILLTDGVNNAGKVSPLVAAEAARAVGVRVYTIAAGTEGEAPMPVRDAFGRERIVPVAVEVDEQTLAEVAKVTGAAFFRATDASSLRRIYRRIDRLEKTRARRRHYERYRELFAWPLLAGLGLLTLELALAETRLRRLP